MFRSCNSYFAMVATAAIISVTPAVLHAQPGESRAAAAVDQQKADELFDKGKAAARRRDYASAYESFKQAWQYKQAYDIAGNLGHTALLLNKNAEAAQYLKYCIENFPPSGDPAKRAGSEQLLKKARERVLALRVTVEPSSAEVVVDGESRGAASALPSELFVEPGQHELQAKLAGYHTATQVVAGEKGKQELVNLQLTPLPAPAAPIRIAQPAEPVTLPKPSYDESSSSRRSIVPALIGGGISVAALATGFALRASAASDKEDADNMLRKLGSSSACRSGSRAECSELGDKYDSENRKKDIATGAFIGAGVVAAATVAYYLWPRSEERSAEHRSSGVHWRASAAVLPQGSHIVILGDF